MKRKIFVFTILGVCATMSAWADYPIGNFVAPKGADGINGTNGTAGCSPRIYQTNKTGGCYQIKSQAQKRVSGVCTDDTSINAVTLDNICDGCTPTYSKKYIHGSVSSPTYNDTSANAIGTRVTVSGCGEDPVNIDTYDGDDGTSFNYKGSVENCDALNNISNPAQNDAYIVNGDGQGKLCIYNGSSWPTTCPDDCAEFTGPAGDNNCTGYEDSNVAVKHTLRTYSGPSNSTLIGGVTVYATRGKMVLTHKMCNTDLSDTIDNENDPCVPIVAPSGVTCNGTYFECKPQGTYDGNTSYAKYNVCEATTGTTFSSALSNKEDAVCVGTNANSSSVERKKTVSYTAPTGSESYGTYSWNTAVGKVVNKSVKCNNSETTISSTPDKCEEIAKPSGVCTESGKVYYKCTRQDNGSEYNLCADGTSVLGAAQSAAQSAAETAVAAVDPCASVANGNDAQKKAQIKSMNSTYTLQTVSSGNDRTAVGYSTVTKTTCATGADATQVEYQYDTCKEIADTRTSGACSGNNKVYLECVNQTKGAGDSGYTYKVCQTVTANTSLTSKINGKADASAVTQSALANTLGSTYLKPSDTISASQLPSTVVTVGDDATHGLNTLLAKKKYVTESGLESAVSSEVTNQINNAGIVTENTLKDNLLDVSVMGNCTTSGGTGDNAPTTTCTENSLMAAIYNQLKNAIDAAGKN